MQSNTFHEFMTSGQVTYDEYHRHIGRYIFASSFVGDKSVLDIASGIGYGSHFLMTKGAKMIVSADKEFGNLAFSKKHYSSLKIYRVNVDAEKLPFSSEQFDIITSFETIEHLTNYRDFLSECRRILKPGGLIIISTPNRTVTSPTGKVWNQYHIKEFTISEFAGLMNEFFKTIDLYGQSIVSPFFVLKHFILQLVGIRILGSSNLGQQILEKYRRRHAYANERLVSFDIINENRFDKTHAVNLLRDGSFVFPMHTIIVGKKANTEAVSGTPKG